MSPSQLHRQLLLGAAFALANGVALCLLRLEDTVARGAVLWESVVSLAVPVVIAALVAFWQRALVLANRFHTFLVIAWAKWPILLHVILRSRGYGDAYEIVAILCLQHASAAAVWGDCSPGKLRTVYVIGGIVCMMIAVLAATPAVLVACGVAGLLGFSWLCASNWQRFDNAPRAEQCRNRQRVRWGLLVVLLAGLGITLLAKQGQPAAYFLSGFMPSSGGEGLGDELARGGIGDGEALVAAEENASSFGALETDLFLESDMPSLYDAFSDVYGEPPPPSKERSRTIALEMSDIEEVKEERAKNLKAGKEFSAARSASRPRDLEDRNSAALLFVKGDIPLHLRLETFDSFDGVVWTNTVDWRDQLPAPQLNYESGEPWVLARSSGLSEAIDSESLHTLKFINLKSERVPSPPLMGSVRIDRLNRNDMFAWLADGSLAMDGVEYIPQLTTMDVRSANTRLQPLRERDFSTGYRSAVVATKDSALCGVTPATIAESHLVVPEDECGYQQLAESWVAGVPRGWRQVEAIVSRLRTEFVVDRSAVPPEECADVVAHFLKNRRGPDFLFASTAAVMLRSLGYPTRMVTGFYADPERYDQRSDSTAVLVDDVHAWAEVLVPGHGWLAVEPTPGYEPPPEWRSWWDWCLFVGRTVLAAVVEHWMLLLLAAILVFSALRFRVELLNWALSVFATIAGLASRTRKLDWTLWLLDRRSSLAGFPRPVSVPVTAWHGQFSDSDARTMGVFLRFVERRMYSASTSRNGLHTDEQVVAGVCRDVRSQVSLKTVRNAFQSRQQPAEQAQSKCRQCSPGAIMAACRSWNSRTRARRRRLLGAAAVLAGLTVALFCCFC